MPGHGKASTTNSFYQIYHFVADNLVTSETWLPFSHKTDDASMDEGSGRFPGVDPGSEALCGAIALCDVELITCAAQCDEVDSSFTIEVYSDNSAGLAVLNEDNLRATTGNQSLTEQGVREPGATGGFLATLPKVLPFIGTSTIIPAGHTWGVKVSGWNDSRNIRLSILTKQTI